MTTGPFLRAARRLPTEYTPVWFMRQAGRTLPEYRKVRERWTLLEICTLPDVCAEVTLQPMRRMPLDAAVMFGDIMLPLVGVGVDLDIIEKVGPVIASPVRDMAGVERLRDLEPEADVPAVLEAVRLVRGELEPHRAVLGFAGAPFTLASYLVEGKPTRDFVHTKALMHGAPEVWHALMERLTETFARYVAAQVRAGADVVQVFDSWAGALSVEDYGEFAAPYSAQILAAVDVPTIHFATGATHLLPALAAAGGDVIGLDWRLPLDEGWELVGEDRGVQGNLDPAVLLGPWERVEDAARGILARAGGRRGHVFNLGHGVLPQTEPERLGRLARLVQEASVEARV
jgi:uroporphyrinogen decarboxylase